MFKSTGEVSLSIAKRKRRGRGKGSSAGWARKGCVGNACGKGGRGNQAWQAAVAACAQVCAGGGGAAADAAAVGNDRAFVREAGKPTAWSCRGPGEMHLQTQQRYESYLPGMPAPVGL